MGGKSKSSATNTTSTQYFDERVTGAEGSHIANAVIHGEGNKIRITDGGAVKDSLTFAKDSLTFAGDAVNAALTFSLASQSKTMEVLKEQGNEQLSFLNSAYGSSLAAQRSSEERIITNITPYLIGGVSIVALMALTRGK